MDPANKCIAFSGFESTDLSDRSASIEAFLAKLPGSPKCLSIEHKFKGVSGNRSVGPLSIVEFACRDEREAVLKKCEAANSTMKDAKNASIGIKRAKTSLQLARNSALHKACDVLKKNALAKEKECKIDFKMDNSQKSRSVTVGGQVAFLQLPGDMSGSFLAPFQDVTL